MSMENPALSVSATDYHTAGEPFRIVSGGVGPILGESVLDKRAWAIENLDRVRRLLVYEPRGHADMYGCFLTEPDDEEGTSASCSSTTPASPPPAGTARSRLLRGRSRAASSPLPNPRRR